MATLSGTRLKDTYTGLLKTSDSSSLTGTLKVVQDGAGNNSALSLSTTTVKCDSLQLNSVTSGSTSTNVLVWDSSTKDVEYRTLPVFESITTTVAGTTSPTITIEDAAGTSKTITFNGQDGIGLSRSGDTINIFRSTSTINEISSGVALAGASSDSGSDYFVDASAGTFDIVLPSCGAGLRYTFYIDANAATGFRIVTKSSADVFKGRIVLVSTTGDQTEVAIPDSDDYQMTFKESGDAGTGGSDGDRIEVIALNDSQWLVTGTVYTTEANPTGTTLFGGGSGP